MKLRALGLLVVMTVLGSAVTGCSSLASHVQPHPPVTSAEHTPAAAHTEMAATETAMAAASTSRSGSRTTRTGVPPGFLLAMGLVYLLVIVLA